MLNKYVPVLILFAFAFVFVIGSVALGGAHRPQARQQGQARPLRVRHRDAPSRPATVRFPVKYYLTAMLFIVFDIEVIFLYPWAVAFHKMGAFGLVEMVLFIADGRRRLRLRLAPRGPRVGLT